MNGTQTGTTSSAPRANSEDIDVVLGRFQSWAATQRAKATAAASPALAPEARELSYEQALRATRFRRPSDYVFTDPRLKALNPDGVEQVPAHTPVEAAFPQPAEPSATALKAAALPSSAVEICPPGGASKPVQPHQDLAQPFATAKGTGAEKAADGVRSRKRKRRGRAAARANTPSAFGDVLKGTALAASNPQNAIGPVEGGRQLALTLRVCDAEHARIQACAAQANLSVAAYLRQCALNVEEMREQVRVAISTLRPVEPVRPVSPPGIGDIPGILGRFALGWFGKLRRDVQEPTLLKLR